MSHTLVLDRHETERLARVTLDFEGSVLSTGRYADGAAIGFNESKKGARNYYPLLCTVAQTTQILDLHHRLSSVHDSNGAKPFIASCVDPIKDAIQLDLFEPRRHECDYQEIVTNETSSAKHVIKFHHGRAAQEGAFAESKQFCQMDYVPVRTLCSNQGYCRSAVMAHNLTRELDMDAYERECHATAKRRNLHGFETLGTLRKRRVRRAGRLIRPPQPPDARDPNEPRTSRPTRTLRGRPISRSSSIDNNCRRCQCAIQPPNRHSTLFGPHYPSTSPLQNRSGYATVGPPAKAMPDNLDRSTHEKNVPMRAELEQRMRARVVTFEDGGDVRPGGMCGCCGGGPNSRPDWRADPWYIYTAGLCDGDGVFYSMLCEGCLEDVRLENEKRASNGLLTERDEQARQIAELLGDDLGD